MHCTEFESELNELLDNHQALNLSPAARQHHEACVPCQATYAAYSKLATAAIIARQFHPVEPVIPTAASVTPAAASRPWSFTTVAAALLPMAAAMYLLGIGLWQNIPDSAPTTANNPGAEVNQGNALAEVSASRDHGVDADPLSADFDTQLAYIKRATVIPIPGIPPVGFPMTKGVEAVRDQWKATGIAKN